ncbi:helix-turn-helix domain-containing protein [Chitinophaga sp. S165]|uniref:helix-turn-helix domain-containing protein n=1 Tax=Chitinophaga sp. S165 TaxID=2135462 RepID=UPI000D8FC2DC|nr:helix-turn-helix transcriptional regulator [Chitinophaga sp. S165]PWV55765.1 helix-turn-helix protein [Chitinophaga sp. S165]
MSSFGKKLREAREAKGFSQAELARQVESHHSIIGKYERDEVKPTIDVVKKLAEVLDTTVGYLFGGIRRQGTLKRPLYAQKIK